MLLLTSHTCCTTLSSLFILSKQLAYLQFVCELLVLQSKCSNLGLQSRNQSFRRCFAVLNLLTHNTHTRAELHMELMLRTTSYLLEKTEHVVTRLRLRLDLLQECRGLTDQLRRRVFLILEMFGFNKKDRKTVSHHIRSLTTQTLSIFSLYFSKSLLSSTLLI